MRLSNSNLPRQKKNIFEAEIDINDTDLFLTGNSSLNLEWQMKELE